ncbi:predicted protein [Sclerotinia sclerotiorum 1980 UF-70]|uniref:Uncharacterized protein n=1 Tax=Sclerotinia sclerotiorum (strain ATCC 18683 / 1980 / Ss-1) TaxID=665079 RepID=A7EHM3_SCLS1|nr:predicted protein [Sclerotinia sclerotiorum 1980 UF-70]EDO02339.1 predicted protein [Sclerotinia sclerotiorum 1980 UF-70]
MASREAARSRRRVVPAAELHNVLIRFSVRYAPQLNEREISRYPWQLQVLLRGSNVNRQSSFMNIKYILRPDTGTMEHDWGFLLYGHSSSVTADASEEL